MLDTRDGRIPRTTGHRTGRLLFLGLSVLMHSPKPPSVLLTRRTGEKGVFPQAIILKSSDFCEDLAKNPQHVRFHRLILTTHSPYLLSAFTPRSVTLLRRKDEIGPVEAFPLRDAAQHQGTAWAEDEFYLGELWYNLSEEELLGHA